MSNDVETTERSATEAALWGARVEAYGALEAEKARAVDVDRSTEDRARSVERVSVLTSRYDLLVERHGRVSSARADVTASLSVLAKMEEAGARALEMYAEALERDRTAASATEGNAGGGA